MSRSFKLLVSAVIIAAGASYLVQVVTSFQPLPDRAASAKMESAKIESAKIESAKIESATSANVLTPTTSLQPAVTTSPTSAMRPLSTPAPSTSSIPVALSLSPLVESSAPQLIPPRPALDVTTPASQAAINASASDAAVLYENGCHLSWSASDPKPCAFGDLSSPITIVLTGDSHAAHWFGALQDAALANHWRLVTVTKSGCPSADVSVFSSEPSVKGQHVVYSSCASWRTKAHAYIKSLNPALVVFPMLSRRDVVGLNGQSAKDAWANGIVTAVANTSTGTSRALVISDTPRTSGSSIPACLQQHLTDQQACSTPIDQAVLSDRISMEAAAATRARAQFLDVAPWMCSNTACSAVVGGVVVYRDEHHLTDSFARACADAMAIAIQQALASEPA